MLHMAIARKHLPTNHAQQLFQQQAIYHTKRDFSTLGFKALQSVLVLRIRATMSLHFVSRFFLFAALTREVYP